MENEMETAVITGRTRSTEFSRAVFRGCTGRQKAYGMEGTGYMDCRN